jgi:DNA-directed RNA polymerase subunit beta'
MNDELKVGGHAFEEMLGDVSIDVQLKKLIDEVKTIKSPTKRDAMVKKIKYLAGLQKMKVKPDEAYIIHNVPVIPPVVRPATNMGANRIEFADINQLYRDHMLVNNSMKDLVDFLPPDQLVNERKTLYDGVKAVFGLGDAISGASRGRGLKGLMTQVAGTGGPKTGLFHNRLLYKKQDFSGRATIYAEPNLGFNEVALPKDMMWNLYKFHILRDLARGGYSYVDAIKSWTNRDTAATASFNKVTKNVPVILNRAPTLLKTNITAHFPIPIEGNTIGLNPLHLPLYAGDYDGDALTVHLPMTNEAVEEAKKKLLPQHQIFNYKMGQGNSMIAPGHEAILGSMHMTEPNKTKPTRHFKTEKEVLEALRKGEIEENDPITIG